MQKEKQQQFFDKLVKASRICIDIEGLANCIKEIDIESHCAKLYLNPALNALCQIASVPSDELSEIEESYHYEHGVLYPAEKKTGG